MIKKSNSIFLKHTLEPQQELRQDLFQSLQEMFEIDVNNYYNNINSKRQRTIRIVSSHYEILKALTLTYNALMNIASNKSIAILTIFTTIVGTLNFVV
jgi:Mg2+ and Co2+ transporter CorA